MLAASSAPLCIRSPVAILFIEASRALSLGSIPDVIILERLFETETAKTIPFFPSKNLGHWLAYFVPIGIKKYFT